MLVLRSCLKAKNSVLPSGKANVSSTSSIFVFFSRTFSDDNNLDNSNPDFSNSTIFIENGFNVQELPVIVRKLKDVTEIDDIPTSEPTKTSNDSLNYHLIQSEFKQCLDLRDVFSLLSKCTKITPNIALGAMERIYALEKDPSALVHIDSKIFHVNLAKGAILDKLLKVVMKTEDTQTILNILNTVSSFMEPYKYKFCDELLFRVIDNKLSVEQLCQFVTFLINNKSDNKYSETIDKLWVGFIEKESQINEINIAQVFKTLPGLKVSKRTILTLLENRLHEIWHKIKVADMQEILNIFIVEKYFSMQSFAVAGSWMNINIHNFDDDSLLDVITKFTRLKYTDDQIENAIEKYIKWKYSKIESHILIVGILNYCMEFQIRNEHILNACSNYFYINNKCIPHSFLKSFIYPFGFLYFDPNNSLEFWAMAEEILIKKFDKMSIADLSSIIVSLIYIGRYPIKVVNRIFSPEYLGKCGNHHVLKRLHLIDTALSLECGEYCGPMLPKDQWSKAVPQDSRIKNIIDKTKDIFVAVAGSPDMLSTAVVIPYLYSDETYLIDVMIHPAGLGSNTFNWKLKSGRNENIAILIHLPDHYCSDHTQLIGPQIMRKKHLRLLGLRVVSLKYLVLSQLYTSRQTIELKEYLIDNISMAEPCL